MKGLFDGLQAVISSIKTIIDGIKMAIQFLISLVKMSVEVLKLVATTIGNTMTIVNTLPNWLIAFAVVSVGVAVLYVILGRETGK